MVLSCLVMVFKIVDFPEPFGPISVRISPGRTPRLIFLIRGIRSYPTVRSRIVSCSASFGISCAGTALTLLAYSARYVVFRFLLSSLSNYFPSAFLCLLIVTFFLPLCPYPFWLSVCTLFFFHDSSHLLLSQHCRNYHRH